jgi:hypothetical protein
VVFSECGVEVEVVFDEIYVVVDVDGCNTSNMGIFLKFSIIGGTVE